MPRHEPNLVDTITVTIDPRPDGDFPLGHPYLEVFWLPVVGPTSTAVLRWTDRTVTPAGTLTVAQAELAAALGLGATSRGMNGPLVKSFRRLEWARLAKITSGRTDPNLTVTVPNLIPVVPTARREAWTQDLRDRHANLVANAEAAARKAA